MCVANVILLVMLQLDDVCVRGVESARRATVYAIYFVAHWQLRQASRIVTMSGAKTTKEKKQNKLFVRSHCVIINSIIILAYVDMMSSGIIMRLQLYNLISY